jgi:hypothetical protein
LGHPVDPKKMVYHFINKIKAPENGVQSVKFLNLEIRAGAESQGKGETA